MSAAIPKLAPQSEMFASFRFGVSFFAGGVVPNPLDIRFKKVKGLSATVKTTPLAEGGQNLYTQPLPSGVEFGNLVLERGMVVGSPLRLEFDAAMSLFKFATSNVLVTLFNEAYIPVSAWFFFRAYPVKWSTSDLDAEPKDLLIESLELAYARMQIMRV
ncbi:phage tail protein [Sorangium sp. So ce1504]|uniref:phage tail protein n=1 Tax=Sorangium sp. So ce1504 TaxID=3133337 RepID=UPI003F625A28